VSDQEVILAYLPSAHIFEMALENLVLFIGGTLGYGNARTLSDTSVRNCAGDMRELRPTVMVGVPQVWETVKKGVISKLDQSSPLLRSLFWGAFNYKSFMTKNGLPGASMLDGIVFKKVRDMTGGRLRFTMNGASGVADDTKNFLSLVLAPMLGGYGLTETCANGALGSPLQYTPNAIGPVPSSIEVKLVSIPDIGYSTDNNPPQGEIYIRGKPTLTEYYGNPEETAKALTEDGWFKTGDIGEWDSVGHLKVIDRVKNLIKMQGGEYIALEKLEAVYRGAHTVANLMVHADQAYPKPIAVIMPNEKVLLDEAQKLGIDQHDMYHHPKMVGWVLKDLQTTGRRAGLTGIEIICNVVITEEEWTPPTVSLIGLPYPSQGRTLMANLFFPSYLGSRHWYPEAQQTYHPLNVQEADRRRFQGRQLNPQHRLYGVFVELSKTPPLVTLRSSLPSPSIPTLLGACFACCDLLVCVFFSIAFWL
jgi:long-chain acyl-CoA synthetase